MNKAKSKLVAVVAMLALFGIHGPAASEEPAESEETVAAAEAAQTGLGFLHARAVIARNYNVFDCDMDDMISFLEIGEHFGQIWLPTDRDRSRGLSPHEYSKLRMGVRKEEGKLMFDDADRDGNGVIDANELRLQLHRMIALVDLNQDGDVTREEAGVSPTGKPFARASFLSRLREFKMLAEDKTTTGTQ